MKQQIDYVIDDKELFFYQSYKRGKLWDIWQDILKQLSGEVRAEAAEKGFDLVEVVGLRTRYSRTYDVEIRQPTKQLRQEMKDIYTRIICLQQ